MNTGTAVRGEDITLLNKCNFVFLGPTRPYLTPLTAVFRTEVFVLPLDAEQKISRQSWLD